MEEINLKGISQNSKMKAVAAELKVTSAVQWYKAGLERNCCAIGHYYPSETLEKERSIPTQVQQLLTQFKEIFKELKGLPPIGVKITKSYFIPLPSRSV